MSPAPDCGLCPNLVAFRRRNQELFPAFFNAPVPAFGPLRASLWIVGLAPGLKGANRTGRPFTGDLAGDVLYPALLSLGLATGRYGAGPEDGLELRDCRIVNAVRCVPPDNRVSSAEIRTCGRFLDAEYALARAGDARAARSFLAIGRVAQQAILRLFGLPVSRFPFGHGRHHHLSDRGVHLTSSYHCSGRNIRTGLLDEAMFRKVLAAAAARARDGHRPSG